MAPIQLNACYRLLLRIARLVLVAVFVTAALPKIQAPDDFSLAIMNYRVSGPVLSAWVALFLPWVELVAGLGLLFLPLKRASGLILSILLLIFIIMHIQAWMRGLEISCGCFGNDPAELATSTSYLWLISRNALLLIPCSLILFQAERN